MHNHIHSILLLHPSLPAPAPPSISLSPFVSVSQSCLSIFRQPLCQYGFFHWGCWDFFVHIVSASQAARSKITLLLCAFAVIQSEWIRHFIYFCFSIWPIWKISIEWFSDSIGLPRKWSETIRKFSKNPFESWCLRSIPNSDCSYRIQPIFICIK